MSSFLYHLTRGLNARSLSNHSDSQLVERVLTTQDEVALQTIVFRHGAMVYRVCRRVLQHPQDAEDAFQATFLVLAQKLRAIRKHASLASWLHGVAHRIAVRSRVRTKVQRQRERQASKLVLRAPSDVTWEELSDALDFELNQLPAKWRLPLILCYLEGQTQDEAASQLGWSKSTLRRRLEEARDALGNRLKGRGISLPAALSAVLLSDCLTSAAPAAGFIFSTVVAATGVAAGKQATLVASAKVASLTNAELEAMLFAKLKIATVVLGLATVFTVLATSFTGLTAAGQSDKQTPSEKPADTSAKQQAAKAEVPKQIPAKPGRLLFFQQGSNNLCSIDPDGKEKLTMSLAEAPGDIGVTGHALLSPDGKQVALLSGASRDGVQCTKLYVLTLGKDDPPIDLEVYCSAFTWSPDGTQLAVSDFKTNEPAKFEATHSLVNLKTKKQTPLPLPSGQIILDWSSDGKHLLTEQRRATNGKATPNRIFLMNLDGTEAMAITSERASFTKGRLSPDGKKLLALGVAGGKPGTMSRLIPVVFELSSGKMSPIPGVSEKALAESCCWSPDGKRIAYSWKELPEGNWNDDGYESKQTRSHLTVCEVDGSNSKTIASAKANGPYFVIFGCIDWR